MQNNTMARKKTSSQSATEMTELVLPNDTNLLGNLLGGRLMHWMDIAGGMTASRHSNSGVVTAAVDNLIFHQPIKLGELVLLKARVTWTGRTSMEILVRVYAENTHSGETRLANEAFFTFVALDEAGMRVPVPSLVCKTHEEKEEFKKAAERRNVRLSLKRQSV